MACICILPGIEKFNEDLFVSAQSSLSSFIRRNKIGRLTQLLNPCSAPDAVPDTSPALTFESSSKSPCQAGGIRICQWGSWGSGKVISIQSLCCGGIVRTQSLCSEHHLSRPCGSCLTYPVLGRGPSFAQAFPSQGGPLPCTGHCGEGLGETRLVASRASRAEVWVHLYLGLCDLASPWLHSVFSKMRTMSPR